MSLNPHDIIGLNMHILILKINYMYKDWAHLTYHIHMNDLGVLVDLKTSEKKHESSSNFGLINRHIEFKSK